MEKKIGFKPKTVTNKLVKSLPERSQDILNKRYGLGKQDEPMTLEAIGQEYGITRERVRQIEMQSLKKLRGSDAVEAHAHVFEELKKIIEELGYVVPEDDLLNHLSSKEDDQKHYFFLLMVGEPFTREKSNTKLHHRWHVSKRISDTVHAAIEKVKKALSPKKLMAEEEILDKFKAELGESVADIHKDDSDKLKRWLKISKQIDSNPLGQWGPASSPIVRLKGMRDYAYLVLKKNGGPLHFSEVSRRIEEIFGKKAHRATTHNELIRDPRFVLVGRGLYALKEWGYKEGVVRDVIRNILEEQGPLPKEEIIDRVLKERYVKPNTVMVNLQNSKHFNRLDNGHYVVQA